MNSLRLSVALLLVLAPPASATWYEARSRHFVVYSQGSAASVRHFAADLESFDQALRKLRDYPDVEGDDPNPVTVYTMDSVSEVGALCKGRGDEAAKSFCRNIAGFYSARVSGSVAFVPQAGGSSWNEWSARTILFHEYAHHLMQAHSGAAYPAWYVEGFAEFVSNVKLDREGEVGIGLPAVGRAASLYGAGDMKMRELLTTTPATLSDVKWNAFYGRAWLLTHYLAFEREREGQLRKYLQDINGGATLDKAASAAFGDLDELDRNVATYLERKRFGYLVVKVPAIPAGTIRIRPLDSGDAAMMEVRVQSDRGVDKVTALQVADQARRIASPYPDDARAQDALAEAEFDAGNLDAAEAAVDRALAKLPDDSMAMVYKAKILMRRANDAGRRDAESWKMVRHWLLKANKVQPDAAWPLFLFYQSFRMQGVTPSGNAVAALKQAYMLVPQDPSVRLTLVNHYLAENKLTEARIFLAPLAYNPHLPPGNPAAELMAQIEGRLKAAADRPQAEPPKKEAK